MLDNVFIIEEFIPGCLKSIEKKYEVKILLAVESGSRAWGFASKDSDWDVRFVYCHKPEWYFSIGEKRDVIEETFINDIDASGWDIKKALGQLKRSNPSFMEWINSPLVYRSDEAFMSKLIPLAQQCFNPTKAMYHYQRIYVKHDERYLQKQGYPMKRYLYYLRGILACQWIEKYKTLPPVSFKELYEDVVEDETVKEGIRELVLLKSSGKEKDMSEVPEYLVSYYLPIAEFYSDYVERFRPEYNNDGIDDILNQVFYDIVMAKKDEIKILKSWERIPKAIIIGPDTKYSPLYWDEDGGAIGDYDCFLIGDEEFSTSSIVGLKEWFMQTDKYDQYTDIAEFTTEGMEEWINQGYEFAKQLRSIIPKDVDVYYGYWHQFGDREWRWCKAYITLS